MQGEVEDQKYRSLKYFSFFLNSGDNKDNIFITYYLSKLASVLKTDKLWQYTVVRPGRAEAIHVLDVLPSLQLYNSVYFLLFISVKPIIPTTLTFTVHYVASIKCVYLDDGVAVNDIFVNCNWVDTRWR